MPTGCASRFPAGAGFAPPELAEHFITVLGRAVREHKRRSVSGSYELKPHGYPWRPASGETMEARRLLLKLLDGLEEKGWTVYADFDQKAIPGMIPVR
jgi:hypothetical protein